MTVNIIEQPIVIAPINNPELILEYIRESIKKIQLKATILERKIINDDVVQKVA